MIQQEKRLREEQDKQFQDKVAKLKNNEKEIRLLNKAIEDKKKGRQNNKLQDSPYL